MLARALSRPFITPTPRLAIDLYWRAHPIRADRLARALAARSGAPKGWTWQLGSNGKNGLPTTFRTPPAPYRESAYAPGAGSCCVCGQPVYRFGWHAVLTNAHVVNACAQIIVRSPAGDLATAQLIARDEKNDLAVIRSATSLSSVAAFRDGKPVRAGDPVVVLGYPFSGLLATTANLTVGNVSALAGLAMTRVISKSALPYSPATAAGHCLMEVATSSGLLQQNLMRPSLLALPETFRRM